MRAHLPAIEDVAQLAATLDRRVTALAVFAKDGGGKAGKGLVKLAETARQLADGLAQLRDHVREEKPE